MAKTLKVELEKELSILRQRVTEDEGELPLPRLEVEFTHLNANTMESVVRIVTGHIRGDIFSSVVLHRTAYGTPTSPISEGIFVPSHAPHFFSCDVAFLSAHLNLPVFVQGVKGTRIRWEQTASHPHQISLGAKARRGL